MVMLMKISAMLAVDAAGVHDDGKNIDQNIDDDDDDDDDDEDDDDVVSRSLRLRITSLCSNLTPFPHR